MRARAIPSLTVARAARARDSAQQELFGVQVAFYYPASNRVVERLFVLPLASCSVRRMQ